MNGMEDAIMSGLSRAGGVDEDQIGMFGKIAMMDLIELLGSKGFVIKALFEVHDFLWKKCCDKASNIQFARNKLIYFLSFAKGMVSASLTRLQREASRLARRLYTQSKIIL